MLIIFFSLTRNQLQDHVASLMSQLPPTMAETLVNLITTMASQASTPTSTTP